MTLALNLEVVCHFDLNNVIAICFSKMFILKSNKKLFPGAFLYKPVPKKSLLKYLFLFESLYN